MATTEPSTLENALALLCITMVSLFGLTGNGLSIFITTTNSHFQNAYGTLRTIVLLCNIQTISVLSIWSAVVILTGFRELSSPTYFIALIPGCLANASFYGVVLVNLLIAVNRYCAFAYPLKYHIFWTVPKARCAGIIVYFFGFLPCLPSIFEPCTLIFNTELDFRWSYSNTSCGKINSMLDTMLAISMIIIAECIDFMTYELFIRFQSCISGLTMIMHALVFNIGPHFLTNKWALFVVTTINWVAVHVLDG
ncbi:unnamed protein product [Cercopithifilaria johnstoni]|uniref:G-protein coupled receptors family 1 profile domain-containing protein n=1 Tax=Cercopithifilaria johnstoni TaxID=2874296 RepID=A0A8J2LW23_9BILA|nr:unnamed protein product [Cercopithifilaria johnstoni]